MASEVLFIHAELFGQNKNMFLKNVLA